VLAWRDGQPVRLADLATVEMRPPERSTSAYQNGNPAIGLRIVRAPGANVLGTLESEGSRGRAARRTAERARLGIEQSFDASVFIKRAVNLLIENLVVGALLALGCVWWFMRDSRATVVIATTIPSACWRRSARSSSLAAASTSSRWPAWHSPSAWSSKERSSSRATSSGSRKEGCRSNRPRTTARGKWACAVRLDGDDDCRVPAGAVLKDVEGQLFADLALTISIAVAFSILVAVTVVPPPPVAGSAGTRRTPGYGAGWPWLTDRVIAWTRTRRAAARLGRCAARRAARAVAGCCCRSSTICRR
jgi:hypothetical protein